VKHFAGYGAAEGGRDYDSVYVPEELMENVYLVPFHAAEEAGAGSFMRAYMDLNEVPATGNHWLLTDVLRKEWGFQGLVLSDAFAVGSLVTHGYARDGEDAAYKAITAGVNMDMASLTYSHNLAKLVKDGKGSEKYLDEMVLPILEAKYDLGLFEHSYADESKADAILSRPEGLALERKLASRSLVLIRNENRALPLSKSLKKVAVIGPLADSKQEIEGGWTVEGSFSPGGGRSHPVTVLAGIKNKLGPNAQVTLVAGPMPARLYPGFMDAFSGGKPAPPPTPEEIADWIAKAKTAAAEADVVIAVRGETASMSGEAGSRSTLDLPGIQEQMLEAVTTTDKPVILVLEGGRPLDIRWAAELCPRSSKRGIRARRVDAVADVLFGDVNPGGKLPVSWPRTAGSEPLYYNHTLTHEPEDAPRFTSRYWDLNSKPLYPFGYGLSYSTFKFANLQLSKLSMGVGDTTEVSVDVTNTSSVAGDAVAQIYIHQRYGSASRPVRQLKGFERIALQPGETKTLKFPLGKDELKYWNPQTKQWIVEPSEFDVWAGEDSKASLHADLRVTQ
jgi:beta-glucosidase